jgi:hypothetical protein
MSDRRNYMPTLPNKEVQATLLRQIFEVNEKKRKLEDYIRTVDSLNKSLMESGARKDIEAYKNRDAACRVATSQ